MAESKHAYHHSSEWVVLYQRALRSSQLLSALQLASLAMSRRLGELTRQQTCERDDILTGLGDLYVLRISAARVAVLKIIGC